MTVTSVGSAVDAMLKLFQAAWTHGTDKIDAPNAPFTMPAVSDVWARWRVQHVLAGQASLGGEKLWDREGVIFIQLFTPLNGDTLAAYDEAETLMRAYEGKRTNTDVWFRNVRIIEPNGGEIDTKASNWYQLNIYADFVYSQLR